MSFTIYNWRYEESKKMQGNPKGRGSSEEQRESLLSEKGVALAYLMR